MTVLQDKLNYRFQNSALIHTALSHSSYANEHHCESNERLEFVGDSVLGMVVATALYQRFPGLPEGKLTRLRADLVCEQSLWDVAQRLELGRYIRLGRGEEQSGGRHRPSILADCVEAVIAALYLDGGFSVAQEFIERYVLSRLDAGDVLVQDYKTALQELVQQTPGHSVVYSLIGESGPDHAKRFTVSVSLCGAVIGSGEGRTKKEAEQRAAQAALEQLRK
ncbi:MAG: ribonuclease III [Oscillospiraceae bacterium]|nr:ribonuclease III [Oscillospiraceae bacterium]MCD7852559.1 ribonuclease III [Oscillospiraceae bacterium]MCD7903974.1 ribonuclease III [Oscillospiraceae bacterium]MCD7934941.1 ribonuclease III [Oscillospiraceae bacterium]MCD8359030.1 ribonuclease III [Oscillospiraceae bacterium]